MTCSLALIHFVQSNSFVDHVEAVVLASGFGHIGVPYPATVTLVTGGIRPREQTIPTMTRVKVEVLNNCTPQKIEDQLNQR